MFASASGKSSSSRELTKLRDSIGVGRRANRLKFFTGLEPFDEESSADAFVGDDWPDDLVGDERLPGAGMGGGGIDIDGRGVTSSSPPKKSP